MNPRLRGKVLGIPQETDENVFCGILDTQTLEPQKLNGGNGIASYVDDQHTCC